jgi:hypothetical protein
MFKRVMKIGFILNFIGVFTLFKLSFGSFEEMMTAIIKPIKNEEK